MSIPSLLLRRLYAAGSLRNEGEGFRFSLVNRLRDVMLTGVRCLRIDGAERPLGALAIELGDGRVLRAADLSPASPARFGLSERAWIRADGGPLAAGKHDIVLAVETRQYGVLEVSARDAVSTLQVAREPEVAATPRESGTPAPGAAAPLPPAPSARHIPYDHDTARNNSPDLIAARRAFAEQLTGVTLEHLSSWSLDPADLAGNIENFVGVAQVPIGIAGPLRINGEHARGEFLIPLATTEGSLVASYNRGMKVLNASGGVTCTVQDDVMQRAPVFIFASARDARAFRSWVADHVEDIRREAEATSHHAKLLQIETYLASKFAFLRFDYATGDAAGQNMVGRATLAACTWIMDTLPGIQRFYLESNIATDKKTSQINVMRTRGKRVTAEATIPAAVLREHLRADPEMLHYHAGVANVGALLAAATNNGLHSANGITAMFIATGQDVANVAEGSAALGYTELTAAGDLYLSITIPSLIVATHGGGTGLATQHECLALLGCVGPGTVNKLAEIVAGVVLAGEISLAGAISSLEWVSAHEQYGRNR